MNKWISSINNVEYMKEWMYDLWTFALLKKFVPASLVSWWVHEEIKIAQGGYPEFVFCNGDTNFVLISSILACGWLMSYSTMLELMQTLLLHVETVQYSFLSRWGQCLISVLALLAEILDASIPLASDLINISERKFKEALELFKLRGEWIDQALPERRC